MSLTIDGARDEMSSLFNTGWLADGTSSTVPVLYEDTNTDVPDGVDGSGNPLPWARFSIRHGASAAATLGGTLGVRRYRRRGIVSVEIYTAFGSGQTLSDALLTVAKNIFEGSRTAGGVVFSGVSPAESGRDGPWYRSVVTAEFEYDEIR